MSPLLINNSSLVLDTKAFFNFYFFPTILMSSSISVSISKIFNFPFYHKKHAECQHQRAFHKCEILNEAQKYTVEIPKPEPFVFREVDCDDCTSRRSITCRCSERLTQIEKKQHIFINFSFSVSTRWTGERKIKRYRS